MASFWHFQYTTAEHPTSPPLVGIQRPLTPLILPRDWLDPSTCYPSADLGDVDFQSNQLDLTSARPPSESLALSGLGIRNIDLDMDLTSFESSVSEVANIFDGAPMLPNLEDIREVNFETFSRIRSGNESRASFRNYSGSASLCGSPWSFSVLRAPELATNNFPTDFDSSFSEANTLRYHAFL
jgi:hypothetical protein